MWHLLGACCIWAILYDLTHGVSLAQVAPLSLIRLLQEAGERTNNSGVSQAFKWAIFFFFSIKSLPFGTISISTHLLV